MNILVVEDDELTAEFIKRVLTREHHFVQTCHDGIAGFKKAQSHSYDALILDISLPGKDGIAICRELRRLVVNTPILMLSSYADEQTKITCLDAGADDYMTKPFGYKELLARLRSITRRPSVVVQSALALEDVVLDPESHGVSRGGVVLHLRPKEYDLLEFMMRNPNTVLPKHLLLNKVWQIRSESASNRLEVYIRHLREKIDKPFKRKLIKTVHGIGYRFDARI
jgi:DNA-binding response OmpR family regulator